MAFAAATWPTHFACPCSGPALCAACCTGMRWFSVSACVGRNPGLGARRGHRSWRPCSRNFGPPRGFIKNHYQFGNQVIVAAPLERFAHRGRNGIKLPRLAVVNRCSCRSAPNVVFAPPPSEGNETEQFAHYGDFGHRSYRSYRSHRGNGVEIKERRLRRQFFHYPSI